MVQRHPKRSDQEWMELIQECRTSGLTDKAWCVSGITFSAAVFIIISGDFETWLAKSQIIPYHPVRNSMKL